MSAFWCFLLTSGLHLLLKCRPPGCLRSCWPSDVLALPSLKLTLMGTQGPWVTASLVLWGPLLCLPSVTVVTAVHIFATIFLYILVTLEIFTLAFDILYFHYDESLCGFVFTEPSQDSLCFIKLKTHFFFKSGKFSTELCVLLSPSGLCWTQLACSAPLRTSVTSPLCFLPREFSTDFFTGCVNSAV